MNPVFPKQHSSQLHAKGLTGYSLIDDAGEIALSYDLMVTGHNGSGWRPLTGPRIQCAHRAHIQLAQHSSAPIHILNGMGVALGDSVIGLSAITALRRKHPLRHIVLHPAANAPAAVQDVYALVQPSVWRYEPLPKNIRTFPHDADIIDIGDFAYWPEFARMPMIDFFAWALGLRGEDLSSQDRCNAWIKDLPLPPLPVPWHSQPYVLVAPYASTPLRTIPVDCLEAMIEQAHARTELPVLGFCKSSQPAFRDISAQSRNTAEFMAWVSGATMLIATDSAAVHLAAGFDVPTLAGFVSIDPALRVAGYPRCVPLDLRRPELAGRHHSDDPALLTLAGEAWRDALRKDIPWPT